MQELEIQLTKLCSDCPNKKFQLSQRGPLRIMLLVGKRWVTACEHGKPKAKCKPCGGNQICEHGKRKESCRDCGGSQICVHKLAKQYCKICGGGAYCVHGKQKYGCAQCGGKGICVHGVPKNGCKLCDGSKYCSHRKRKYTCLECNGRGLCEHKKEKIHCKDCLGSSFCEHLRKRSNCRECGGSSICEHNKIRTQCKECGGGSICVHNLVRSVCRLCLGSRICVHLKLKPSCRECSPVECNICFKILSHHSLKTHQKRIHGKCESCGTSGTSDRFELKYCYQCGCFKFGRTPMQKRQDQVFTFVETEFDGYSDIISFDSRIADSLKRPDIFFALPHRNLFVEVDEFQHGSEFYRCSSSAIVEMINTQTFNFGDINQKITEISAQKDLRKRMKEDERMVEIATVPTRAENPSVFIRFNPDKYKDDQGKEGKLSLEERLQVLQKEIEKWLDDSVKQSDHILVVHLFYDGQPRTEDALPADPDSLKVYETQIAKKLKTEVEL